MEQGDFASGTRPIQGQTSTTDGVHEPEPDPNNLLVVGECGAIKAPGDTFDEVVKILSVQDERNYPLPLMPIPIKRVRLYVFKLGPMTIRPVPETNLIRIERAKKAGGPNGRLDLERGSRRGASDTSPALPNHIPSESEREDSSLLADIAGDARARWWLSEKFAAPTMRGKTGNVLGESSLGRRVVTALT